MIYIILTSVMHSTTFKSTSRDGTAYWSNLGRLLFITISASPIIASIFSILCSGLSLVSPQSIIRFDKASLAQSSALDILIQTDRVPSGLSFGLFEGRRGIDTDRVNFQSLRVHYWPNTDQYLLYLHLYLRAHSELFLHIQW